MPNKLTPCSISLPPPSTAAFCEDTVLMCFTYYWPFTFDFCSQVCANFYIQEIVNPLCCHLINYGNLLC